MALLLLFVGTVRAQKFFNLTAEEVKIDTVLPHFTYTQTLPVNHADSVYTVSIEYPEFIDMSAADVAAYHRLSDAVLPALPEIRQSRLSDRRQGLLKVDFCPLVFRNGRYRMLVSFMLRTTARPVLPAMQRIDTRTPVPPDSLYAAHSVLSSGKWAKIRVGASGVYRLSENLIRKAGFSDLSKVKIYGYGGALQNEKLTAADLERFDDLKEVPTCTVDGRRLFHAQGAVSWSSDTATMRTRNPYSDYGYYFITETDTASLTVTPDDFLSSFYPSPGDYHSLHEIDNYSWYHGGRKLFEDTPVYQGSSKDYTLSAPEQSAPGKLYISITAGNPAAADISLNGTPLGRLSISTGKYDMGNAASSVFSGVTVGTTNTVTITTVSGGPVRLDHISLTFNNPRPAPVLASDTYPEPEYVYNITPQDLHADGAADMIIIIPTSQKLLTQARRLADFHTRRDGMRVRIVPADELYNEFSSGTPDANAYRRYLKMLYDRYPTPDDMPKYLLLFGDCTWDNRMRTADWTSYSPDDFLLCFESENSFNKIYCYVDDGFFTLLDDGEGADPTESDMQDVAVGRFPVRTDEEAKAMVNKTIAYIDNTYAGDWQNMLVFMGDDGDDNLHMKDLDETATKVETAYPAYQVRRILWDSFRRERAATGNTYPEVTKLIKQQQAAGALIMDYAGHGAETSLSHEKVLMLNDFSAFRNDRLPLWITASCDIMPFDGVTPTIGEAAVLNPKGGAVAFFGTTRTVYANYNKVINMAFLRYVLSRNGGRNMTIGEAQRQTKNFLITSGQDCTVNKLQYSLLGDPALALKLPERKIVIDSINGTPITVGTVVPLPSGSITRVSGRVLSPDGTTEMTDFNGLVSAIVRDAKELIVCKKNDDETTSPMTYYDRTKILFAGSDSVKAGRFTFVFAVPMDINYIGGTGLINVYAMNAEHTQTANGYSEAFITTGGVTATNDSIGPSLYCYLNSPSFTSGARVNSTPYFVAKITDKDGINTTGNGIGHDLELTIDGDIEKTYILNNNFVYDFGSYTSGTTYYSLPELSEGLHTLRFRAWDILNNPSTVTLTFHVVKGLKPTIYSIDTTENPARNATTFIVNHDRMGSDVTVTIEVYDLMGCLVWSHSESGVSDTRAYTYPWNLIDTDGKRLHTGIYLYRIRVHGEGGSVASKVKKLVIINNK